MEIREDGSVAQIWLTVAEQNDTTIKAALGALIRQYRLKGYLPVIYRSGDKDLSDGIKDLLIYHKKLSSEREDRTGHTTR